MKYAAVLPYVYKPDYEGCIATLEFLDTDDLLIVDNTQDNIGVSKSWNYGVKGVLENNLDWLIVISTSLRFGRPGGLDFLIDLDMRMDHHVVEADGVFGWHLIAFSRDCLERVGKFDENLPAYFNDIDYSLRIQKAYNFDARIQPIWEKVTVAVKDLGMARSHKLAGITDPAEPRIAYFEKKWGRHPGDYKKDSYTRPFNDPNNGIGYWPQVTEKLL